MKNKTIKNIKIIQLKSPKEIANTVSELFITEVMNNEKPTFILATGSSPVETYKRIINDHKENETS
jgi:glucosamine-6-phosphate deaminase